MAKISFNKGLTNYFAFLCLNITLNALAALILTNGQLSLVKHLYIPSVAFYITLNGRFSIDPYQKNISTALALKNIISFENYGIM